MNRILKLLKENRIITLSIFICILSSIYMILANRSRPELVINGYNLSINENKMYIDGAVKNPGIYVFKDGQTLEDIINVAGGLNENADIDSIDFKYVLREGEKITIKYVKEDNYELDEVKSDLIDINSATKEELMTLEGIGEKMAQSIINYREKERFEEIEDLLNVDGIGEKKFSNIKSKIIVK